MRPSLWDMVRAGARRLTCGMTNPASSYHVPATTNPRPGRVRAATLVAATLAMGYVGSVFVDWSTTIIPGLRNTDDRTFVVAYQQLDQAIMNPLFLGFGFLGALVLTGLAGVLHSRPVRPWIAAAFVLYLVAFVVTFAVNEPLNVVLRNAGDPNQLDLAAVRAEFRETTWLVWNHVRSVVSMAAFGLLCQALIVFGRTRRA
jgi:uncharacterized membrane protein